MVTRTGIRMVMPTDTRMVMPTDTRMVMPTDTRMVMPTDTRMGMQMGMEGGRTMRARRMMGRAATTTVLRRRVLRLRPRRADA